MNFQRLYKIEKKDTYLDIGINRAKTRVQKLRPTLPRDMPYLMKRKRLTQTFITTLAGTITSHYMKALESYPRIDDLPVFYRKLISFDFSIVQLKKSLAALKWVIQKLEEFSSIYQKKVSGSREKETIDKHKREFIGRTNSLLRQITKECEYLEEFRRTTKTYPNIKEMKTVALFGFPNVGKSTLLTKLTPAKPEVASYVFTTKSLNAGYLKKDYKNIQIIDTPGTLNRFEQMNALEKQAALAIHELAGYIVYVFDPTQQSLNRKKQFALYQKVRDESKKDIVIYVSKADLLDETKLAAIIDWIKKDMEHTVFTSSEDLKSYIIEHYF